MNSYKFLLIALLGFASGLPLALTSSTLQAWATQAGLSLMTIGALSFVGQAYAFKVLWAPLIDRSSLPFISDFRRSWLVWSQLAITLGLALMATCHLPQQFEIILWLAIAIAMCSATFDTAFDAFRIDYLSKKDYALGNAVYITAYRIAMLVSGGLALVMAAYYGWRWVYALMAFLALLGACASYFVPATQQAKASNSFGLTLKAAFMTFPRYRIAWILAFIVLYKFGEAFGTALSTSFLMRVGHFTLVQIGFTYKTCGLLATLTGGFIGAVAYRYYALKYLMLLFGLLQALGLAWYIPIAAGVHHVALMMTAVIFEAGSAAMATTVFVSFLMRLCQTQAVATQFALLTALAAIGRIVTGPMAAKVIEQVGWVDYYYLSILVCLPALVILFILWRHPVFD